jgi:PIN domain nuclease of toxin-antitoxin system
VNAVLDTCALLDLMLRGYTPPVPGPWAASAISWCEIAWKNRLGQLNLGPDRNAFFDDLVAVGVHALPIDPELTLAAVDLPWDHRDPADRLIVALAQQRRLPLITRDAIITAWYPHCRW